MSQITNMHRISLLIGVALALMVGCGTANEEASFNADTRKHASNWLPARHTGAATADIASCRSCHGNDLLGGISGVTCTSCHIGGTNSAHPTAWAGNLKLHGPYVYANGGIPDGLQSCQNIYCHGAGLRGVPDSGPACSSCH